MSEISLFISKGDELQYPILAEEITWKTERKGSPGELTFTTVKDELLSYPEGSPVSLIVDGQKVFYGFVFTKSRDKNHHIKVTAYDQLRYLKNKDTLIYEGLTCGELIKKLASMFHLRTGVLADTDHRVTRTEDNVSLFDMIQNNLDEVVQAKGKMYVLYDDYGKITLRDIENLVVPYLIDQDCIENFDYQTSIDSDVYNKIKLYYDDKDAGVRDVYIAQDSSHINQWGVLQNTEAIQNPSIAESKVNGLLALYNRVARNLSVKGAVGDLRVRAGCHLPVHLYLGDMTVKQYLIAESVTHTWKDDKHSMDITLMGGGGFIA